MMEKAIVVMLIGLCFVISSWIDWQIHKEELKEMWDEEEQQSKDDDKRAAGIHKRENL